MEKKSIKIYVFNSILAGICISLASCLSYVVLFYSGSKIASAISFAVGLILCSILNADLFTGKSFILFNESLERKILFRKSFGYMFLILFFNFIGTLIFAFMFYFAFPKQEILQLIGDTAIVKSSLGILQIFIRAILCNLFVCLGTYFAIKFKEKPLLVIVLMFLVIPPFVLMGFEHSIANFNVYTLAILKGTSLKFWQVMSSIFFSILGNLCMGIIFASCYFFKKNKKN